MGNFKKIDFIKVISLRSIVKKIFPRVFLKRAFLVLNSLKAETWDRVFFRKLTIPLDHFSIHEEKNPFLSYSIDTSKFDSVIKAKLNIWENPEWIQDQYLLDYREEGFIEPKVGWGVSLNKRLLYPSLGFASAPHVRKPDFFEFYFKRRIVNLDQVISLRDTGEENYFHFFNDVLAKLFFLRERGILLDKYTIVVGQALSSKQYFQYFLHNSFLNKLKWHVQKEHEWIHFKEGIFCKPFTHSKIYFDKAVELVMKEPQVISERRIFLNRSPSSLRYIENFSEIETVLNRYKFEVVDASALSMSSQMELFGQCRHLIAIHGAGITNVIFRKGKPLSVLEIAHPSPYIPFHYIMLAKLYKYDYDVILGEKGKQSGKGGFVLNVKTFEQRLQRLLDPNK